MFVVDQKHNWTKTNNWIWVWNWDIIYVFIIFKIILIFTRFPTFFLLSSVVILCIVNNIISAPHHQFDACHLTLIWISFLFSPLLWFLCVFPMHCNEWCTISVRLINKIFRFKTPKKRRMHVNRKKIIWMIKLLCVCRKLKFRILYGLLCCSDYIANNNRNNNVSVSLPI